MYLNKKTRGVVINKSQKDSEDKESLLGRFVISLIIVVLTLAIAPDILPDLQPAIWSENLDAGVVNFWWILGWGFGINALLLGFREFLVRQGTVPIKQPNDPADTFVKGLFISGFAGISEEITYRILAFCAAFTSLTIGNFLTCGLLEWLYVNVFLWVANVGTLGLVENLWFHPSGWLFGAAMLSTCAFFREGHAYQGFLGWVNSWYFSVAMFALLMSQGLFACIVYHFLFNVVAFTVLAIHNYRMRNLYIRTF